MNLVLSLIFGAIAGWAAGKIMGLKGGILRNVILGVAGGFVGKIVADAIGLSANSTLGSLIISIAGACIVILIGKILFK